MRSYHSRSLVSLCVALALVLGGLIWLAPGADVRRTEPSSGSFVRVDSSFAPAPVVLEAEPAIARTPATSSVGEERVESPLEIEFTREDLVAQREALVREVTDVMARLQCVNDSLALFDESSDAPAKDSTQRMQLGGNFSQRGIAYRSVFADRQRLGMEAQADQAPIHAASERFLLYSSRQ